MKPLRIAAGILSTGVLAATGIAAWSISTVNTLNNNLTVVAPAPKPSNLRTAAPGTGVLTSLPTDETPFNMLVLGSDTRDIKGSAKYGNQQNANIEGERSDTTIFVHVYPGRTAATAVSIPRDSIVDIPECEKNGVVYPASSGRFNEAYSRGGVSCTVETIQNLTGLPVDHFAVLNFNGFKNIVDAVGGVDVCIPEPINDPNAKLVLPAGKQTLKGENALGYVRARETIGDGSDLQRISRQQTFIASLAQKTLSKGTLGNPVTLHKLGNATTKHLTVDSGLGSIQKMVDLAATLRNLQPSEVAFVTVPTTPNDDGATVTWKQPEADTIWEAFANNTPYPTPPTRPFGQTALTSPPNTIQTSVVSYNNSTDVFPTASLNTLLNDQGYPSPYIVAPREAPKKVRKPMPYTFQIVYSPDQAENTRTVAWTLSNITDTQNPAMKFAVETVLKPAADNLLTVVPAALPDSAEWASVDWKTAKAVAKKQRISAADTTPLTVDQNLCETTN